LYSCNINGHTDILNCFHELRILKCAVLQVMPNLNPAVSCPWIFLDKPSVSMPMDLHGLFGSFLDKLMCIPKKRCCWIFIGSLVWCHENVMSTSSDTTQLTASHNLPL
jgi:hypothetical protein